MRPAMTKDNLNTQTVWKTTLENIKISVSGAIFSTWFLHTHLFSVQKVKNRFVAEIGCNTTYVKSFIELRYFGLIQDNLSLVLGGPCDIVFVVKQDPLKTQSPEKYAEPLFATEDKDNQQEFLEALKKARIRSGFSFENYAVSSSNQMAHAAAEAVAKTPGTAYNPLFIWGGVGVGKTHLMVAIGHRILSQNLNKKVLFCTGEDFTNDIVEGIRNKTTPVFRERYRKLDALLIDDIQFIAGKDAIQEEFFHTFNAVTSAGGQIILTSDKPPSEIAKFEERLRSRFEAGLIVDITPPDFELRCAILQIKSKDRGIDLTDQQVQLIAANIESARKMEGILIRLLSEVVAKKLPITDELIQGVLGKGSQESSFTPKATASEVIERVSKFFSLRKRDLLGSSRVRPIARPRQILMYLLRTHLNLPLEEVGRIIGGRDHTTVMHAVDKITTLASEDVQIREDVLGIKRSL